jgi:hypothetical protein
MDNNIVYLLESRAGQFDGILISKKLQLVHYLTPVLKAVRYQGVFKVMIAQLVVIWLLL